MPVRDDWASAAVLIHELDEALAQRNCAVEVFLVDDGSVHPVVPREFQTPSRAVQTINVIHLRRNLGHQRAIAIGLAYLQAVSRWGAVLVMDADGEDTPARLVIWTRWSSSCPSSGTTMRRRYSDRSFHSACAQFREASALQGSHR